MTHESLAPEEDVDNDGSTLQPPAFYNTPPSTFATPGPASTKAGSRPSTAGSAGRPGSRQGLTEGSLAGPAGGKHADLPEQKAKWVDSMLEKAKAASAEKGKGDKEKYFGELGKAGGTRRVIFRSSSGTPMVKNDENSKP